MSVVTLGVLAAVFNAGQALLSKGLTRQYPARQLVGPLLLMNCLLLLPFAPFVEWAWSPEIVLLHVISAVLMVVSSVAVWDLFEAGAASATMTAQALSPLATAIGAALLVPGSTSPAQVVASIVVVGGVMWALQGSFDGLSRRGSALRIVVTAASIGMLTVMTRMLADFGVGVVETYVVRTAVAGLVVLLIIWPGDVPRSAAPRMLTRSAAATMSFVLIILAVQRGSPVVVQTLLAITPLLILGWESLQSRAWPAGRAVAGATLVLVGVVVILAI